MKRLSLRVKITLMFAAALLTVVVFTYIMVLSVSDRILQKTIKDNLIETVENNFNKIRFYPSLEELGESRDTSHFFQFASGYLEINDDFLDEVNQVYTALYTSEAALLYGENPIPRETLGVVFQDSRIQTKTVNGTDYYIFDRKLISKGLDGLWIRGVVSEDQGTAQMGNITRISLVLLLMIVLLSCIGSYFIVKRMLRPIQEISETARQIGEENDLKKRIELSGGKDELHRLADTFNDMFDKLEKAFETQRQFISDASHELRTPMAVISAQCELSLEKPQSREEYERAFRVVRRQSRKLNRMIGDMLDFTRLEAGTDRYGKEKLDLTELVDSVCQDMALIGENGIRLTWEAQEGVEFTGNRELLTRLLTNLISNAYRYGKPDGHIRVGLKQEGEEICLTVADDGIGIAEEEQEKIFRRFYQADTSRSGEGTGLGLSMAYEIARFHGGRIAVASRLGEGSTFTVVL